MLEDAGNLNLKLKYFNIQLPKIRAKPQKQADSRSITFTILIIYIQSIFDMKKIDDDCPDINEEDQFDPVTKMPPFGKPPINPGHPTHSTITSYTHSEQMSTANKKHYEPLSWDLFFDELSYLDNGTSTFRAGHQGALIFCIHGAGHSSMSFACLAKQVKHFSTLIAFDFKGHGASKNHEKLQDMSIETLVNETIQILKEIMHKYPDKNVVLVGHSLGGSVCARVADKLTNIQKQPRIVGAIIIDVVQGTALEALPFMNQILNDRPKYFDSNESAIKWSIQTATLRKIESARVSIPTQLMQVEHKGKQKYTWKVNLKETEKFWHDWFKGLSKIFLSLKIPKILVTAQKQRMDKELTIAQMQGKFKLTILHGVGHSVQEDDYKGTARMLYEFLKDFRIPMTLSEVAQKQLKGIANFHPNLNPY